MKESDKKYAERVAACARCGSSTTKQGMYVCKVKKCESSELAMCPEKKW